MLFSNPTPPKPINLWFQNPAAVERLREILADPYFQQACAILLAASLPTRSSSASDPERNGLAYSWMAGYADFANDLVKLTKMPGAKGPDGGEWLHVTPLAR